MTEKTTKKENADPKNFIKEAKPFIIGISLYLLMVLFFDKGFIESGSMEPTLMTGKTVIYENVSRFFVGVKRGDIVEFKKNGYLMSKRVIGIAGDEIQLRDGYVFLNGNRLEESYLPQNTVTDVLTADTYVGPDNCVCLLGDNRCLSADARVWDDPYVSLADITGKLFFII